MSHQPADQDRRWRRRPWWRRAAKTILRAAALRATWLFSFVLFLLARTWRIEMLGYGPITKEHREGARVIYAFGHGRMLPFIWSHRNRDACVLISEHFDGELITRVVESFGNTTARGSATRGGARALLRLMRAGDRDIVVTPDGPKGPFLSVKPGVVWIASRARMTLYAVSWDADRRIQFGSWDRFRIPLVGARIVVVIAPPRRIAEDADEATLEAARVAVERDLAECERVAMARFGRIAPPPPSTPPAVEPLASPAPALDAKIP